MITADARGVIKDAFSISGKLFGQNEEFSVWVRMLKSLAFVPSEQVNEYYKALKHIAKDPDERRLGNWFQRNYIGSTENIPPKYDTQFWTIADTLPQNFPPTQNTVEAWHRQLKVVLGNKNLGIYESINQSTILLRTKISTFIY